MGFNGIDLEVKSRQSGSVCCVFHSMDTWLPEAVTLVAMSQADTSHISLRPGMAPSRREAGPRDSKTKAAPWQIPPPRPQWLLHCSLKQTQASSCSPSPASATSMALFSLQDSQHPSCRTPGQHPYLTELLPDLQTHLSFFMPPNVSPGRFPSLKCIPSPNIPLQRLQSSATISPFPGRLL